MYLSGLAKPSREGLVLELGGGKLVDTSGKNIVITNNGATLTADHNGRANRGFVTNLASSYLEFADNDDLDIVGDCTIIWAGLLGAATAVNKNIISKYQNNDNFYLLQQECGANERIRFYIRLSGPIIIDLYLLSGNTEYNKFAMYAFVIDSQSSDKMYINGVQKLSKAHTVNNAPNTGNLRLGRYPFFDNNTNVTHDYFAKYNRALSTSEIQKFYNYWRSH